MSNSTSLFNQISSSQASKEVTANGLFDAMTPSGIFGRHDTTTSGLTWGFYGGYFAGNAIANGTITLTNNATNYVEADSSGVVHTNTTAFTSGRVKLYSIVTASGAVTGYTDYRETGIAASVTAGGTVTSVALSAPAEFTVSGSPVTTSGTLTFSKANQSVNLVYAGPATGAAAAPTFRALVPADYPVFGASGASHAQGAVPDPGSTAGTTRFLREDGTWANVSGASGGTVTSVAMTVPGFLSVSGSPITSSGTLAVTLATESANTVFAGPSSGAAATPTFRSLAYADLPSGVGPGKPRVSTVTYGATVTLDCSIADIFYIALTGNIAITFSNGTDGQKVEVRTKQDATGGRTVTFSNGTYGATITSTASAASTAANKRDKWGFEYDGTAATYDLVSFAGGY